MDTKWKVGTPSEAGWYEVKNACYTKAYWDGRKWCEKKKGRQICIASMRWDDIESPFKLTPWFPRGTNPVRVGVYMTFDANTYQHWNGRKWGLCSSFIDTARSADICESFLQMPKWRGILK